MKELDWYGLYGEGWQNEIVSAAFSHPAKFARGLIRRIYEHALERGWLAEGDIVLDPFAGVVLGAVDALAFGLNWIGNELEAHFVDIGRGCECTGISKEDWRRCFGRWKRFAHRDGRRWCPRCLTEAEKIIEPQPPALPGMGPPPTASYERNSGRIPHTEPHYYMGNLELFARHARNGARAVLLQGDSRDLLGVLGGARAQACVSSPPYVSGGHHNGVFNTWGGQLKGGKGCAGWATKEGGYGGHPANLGNMREGDHEEAVKAVVSSPPYANRRPEASGGGINLEKQYETYRAQGGGASFEKFCQTQRLHSQDYGQSPGQLAAMPEGAFEAAAVVSSPPYEGSMDSGDENADARAERTGGFKQGMDSFRYGQNPFMFLSKDPSGLNNQQRHELAARNPQLGALKQDTFWSAAHRIVEQCWLALAPNGVAIWVLKSFVRNKAVVDFPDQWRRMCEACGFETVEWIRAWLVEDRGAQWALDGELVEKRVERKSFFRRLHERKYPDLSIDYEVVLVMRKPQQARMAI